MKNVEEVLKNNEMPVYKGDEVGYLGEIVHDLRKTNENVSPYWVKSKLVVEFTQDAVRHVLETKPEFLKEKDSVREYLLSKCLDHALEGINYYLNTVIEQTLAEEG